MKKYDPKDIGIEVDVPIFGRFREGGWAKLLKRMKPGHSFILPSKWLQSHIYEVARKHGIKVVTRTMPSLRIRVWRV